jgi:hypothetical protein
MCQQLNQLAERARTKPYFISVYKQGENENYEIAQYSAKSLKLLGAKIAQFPKGSRFIMTNGSPKSEEQKKLDSSVRDLLNSTGWSPNVTHTENSLPRFPKPPSETAMQP